MNPVIVKFAGAIDPVVHRKAISDGRKVPPGGSKKTFFRGYLITISAGREITTANVIDLGLVCIAAWGVSMIYEQNNSFQEIWRLPQRLRLKDGGGRLPVSVNDLNPDADDRTGFPQWVGWINRSHYRNKAKSAAMNRTTVAASMDGDAAGGYAPAAKTEAGRWGVTHAWVGGTVVAGTGGATGQDASGIGPYLTRYRLIGASLQLTHWSSSGSWMVRIQDDWVSQELGADLLFIGGAWRTAVDSVVWSHPWLRVGATSSPRLVDDPGEGGVGVLDFPHVVTRESPFSYRQSCHPGIAIGEGRALVAAPMARLDDDLFELHGSWSPDGAPVSGYVSARSLANSALFEVGAALISAAWHPELVLMRFEDVPVTLFERENWWRFSDVASPDLRYVMRVQGSRYAMTLITPAPGQQPVPNPDGYPTVGSSAMGWAGGTRLAYDELPGWLQPGTVADRSAMFRSAIGNWAFDTAPEVYIPLIDSEHRLPAMFGAVYATCIGEEAEFLCSVKALDNALVDIGATRRATDDQLSAPSQALLAVAKTGLVFVRASLDNPGGYTITTAFHDVLGPADCEQYQPGMDATTAFLPQVRYGCVLGEQRAYAVRALRYQRNPFLASKLSHIGVNVPMPYTEDYAGRQNSTVGAPIFYTDQEFGPYPDRAKYEELWFIIDGERYVIDTLALGGNIEPITEGKYGNGVLDLFQWFGSSINSHRRQMLSMFSAADENDYELLDFYAEEFVCPGNEMNTFAQVSDTDIMFVLHQRTGPSAGRRYNAVICRFSSTTGEAVVVGTVLDQGQQTVGPFTALTCYQFEAKNAEGEVVQEPCLLLRMGANDIGQVYTSVDGGVNWQLLYDQNSTRKINFSGNPYSPNGTPSLGLHVIGAVGGGSDPQNIVRG
ncbi:hypothetical protein N619_01040 [Ectopseudomonas oleovorans]|nr:hypothetical protein N619_01040 [Pseudomonas oleovorans]